MSDSTPKPPETTPPRAAPLDAPATVSRTAGVTRRWARETFSREQIISGLKQLAWVAPLTFLIWVYAEREQQTTSHIRFPVEVHSSNPKVVVRLADPSDGYISADLTGPRVQLDDLRKDVGPRMIPVRFEIPGDYKEGEHQILVTTVVSRDARFESLSVTKSEPTRIVVVVDPIEEVIIPVQMRDEDKALFDQVSFNPQKIKAKMPRQVFKEATKNSKTGGQLTAFADLSTLKDLPAGKKLDVSGIRVLVENADPDSVSIEPSTVSVSLNVRERAKQLTIAELPLRKDIVAGLPDDLVVKLSQRVLFSVVVSGPPEVIDKIPQDGGEQVKAFITITPEDVQAQTVQKHPWFHLPPGTKVDPPKEPIEVTITHSANP